MVEVHEAVWAKLCELPKPVTTPDALAAAAVVLDPIGRTQQFAKWFETNGEALLRRLNG